MKNLRFTKMHALGNDFVIINAHDLPVKASELPIQQLSHRHLGIGFDQLLIVTPKQKLNEFFCEIFNADGSCAEQCGNGLRCVARFIHESGLCEDKQLHLSTIAGKYTVTVENFSDIRIDMGVPNICEERLAFTIKSLNADLELSILEMGNPHALIFKKGIAAQTVADEIAQSHLFKRGANVGFAEVINEHHLKLRTFERGSGETLACGSNACAAAVAGITQGLVRSPVAVEFKHGTLQIAWKGAGQSVEMSGPASRVYEGEVNLLNDFTCP